MYEQAYHTTQDAAHAVMRLKLCDKPECATVRLSNSSRALRMLLFACVVVRTHDLFFFPHKNRLFPHNVQISPQCANFPTMFNFPHNVQFSLQGGILFPTITPLSLIHI